jgi:hypothetical protein
MSTEPHPTVDDARADARYHLTRPRLVLEHFFGGIEYVLDLPDAEHIHVTRHPDGTVTAVAMRRLRVNNIGIGWVDVEGGA